MMGTFFSMCIILLEVVVVSMHIQSKNFENKFYFR